MNDKDKEAFEKWWDEERGGKPLNEDHVPVTEKQLYRWENEAWQAACDYKDKEYSNLIDAMTRTSQYNSRLQAENKKLKEVLEFYANNQQTMTTENGIYLRDGLNGDFFPLKEKAREALKEIRE